MWEEDDNEADSEFDPDKQRERLESIPVFQKAEEIRELVQRLVETMDKDNPEAEVQSSLMLEDSLVIPSKIAGDEAVSDYILKMENAVVIKIHARNLLARIPTLEYLNLVDLRYLQLLRSEMESFKTSFKLWVQSFERSASKDGDGWGLFVNDPDG